MKSESIERWEVSMEEPVIISNPKIMVGKPIIKGTRITVELILDKLAAGQTVEQILEDYPHLTREGIRAALDQQGLGIDPKKWVKTTNYISQSWVAIKLCEGL
jgi:uncharacterized protein (DUF433 family)